MQPTAVQEESLEWLAGREHAIDGSKMGTGKTPVAVWACQQWVEEGRIPKILVVCRNTAKPHWARHFQELTNWPYTILDSKNRGKSLIEWQQKGGVLIIHWESLRLLTELWKNFFDVVIADECHAAKNRKAAMTKALKRIPTKHKLGCSGTPMINRPDELWSILNWLYPKEFTSYHRFFNQFCEFDVHPQLGYKTVIGPKNVPILRDILARCMCRREKDENLPPKVYTPITIPMIPIQQAAHDDMKRQMMAWVRGEDEAEVEDKLISAPVVVAQLTRMRQFAAAHCVVGEDGKVLMSEPSNKLDVFMELLEDLEGEKVVVFSVHKGILALLEERLKKKHVTYAIMTGNTKNDFVWQEFQNDPKIQCFLSTIAKGGESIELFSASNVVFLERSWSNKDNWQAEDRLHRRGQLGTVNVINIISKGSVDLYVNTRLQTKAKWFREVIEGIAPQDQEDEWAPIVKEAPLNEPVLVEGEKGV